MLWGKRVYRKKLGHVGDFCAICRKITANKVEKRTLRRAVLGIPVSAPLRITHDKTCCDCGTQTGCYPSYYQEYLRRLPKHISVEALSARTFPDIYQRYDGRLQLEQHVYINPKTIGTSQRYELLQEPFDLLSSEVDQKMAQGCVDWQVILTFILLLAAPVGSFYLGVIFAWPVQWCVYTLMASVLILGIVALNQISLAKSRWVRRRIFPRLSRAVRPLLPTDKELEIVFDKYTRQRKRIAHRRDKKALLNMVHKTPITTATTMAS
ncbi:hypothetical protein VST7929_00238 [Vibrio stylophorae]|uniref:Transmembrane protein n=1 Tax=Vibrio stylophorae TaxID=659351 RepID=A0ABN8DUE2_9VIBR|nr:hypothetical protein [Vibrio stylophorae]CAH0532409.1 hypothetical protein VST7929_00238 [Vibrio stylophorae]